MKFAAFATLSLILGPGLNAQMAKEASANTASPIITTVRQMEGRYAKNLSGAADEMPADKYSYRPTPEQITFGHLMMHVAEANYGFCAAVAGESKPETKLSETDTKDLLSKAVKDSFAYCEKALSKADDGTFGQTVTVVQGQSPTTRGAAVVRMVAGWADHYSAAAMYLRLNNLLPPSAKPEVTH